MQLVRLLCIALLVSFSACKSSSKTADAGGDDEGPAGPMTGATCPKSSTLTYDNFAKDFFSSYCTRCHATSVKGAARMGAPDDHNFETLDGIKEAMDHVDEVAGSGPKATNTKMPPDGAKPSMTERQKLAEWLACGAP